MAKGSKGRARSSRGGAGVGGVLLGVLAGAVLALLGVAAYLTYGSPPVAVNDRAAVWEPLVGSVPLRSRAHAEAKRAPFPSSEEVFEAGARIYRTQCASCHGSPGQNSSTGVAMFPAARQFFSLADRRGRAPESAGEIYWKTAFGVRRSGMPAYRGTLSDTQLWQVSLLLHESGGELPDPVRSILTAGVPPPQPSEVKP